MVQIIAQPSVITTPLRIAVERGRIIVQGHFQLIVAEADTIPIAQGGGLSAPDRRARLIEISAISAEIRQLPPPGAQGDPAMRFGKMAVRIGNRPIIIGAAANIELSAADLTLFRHNIVRATDHHQLQNHVQQNSRLCRPGF